VYVPGGTKVVPLVVLSPLSNSRNVVSPGLEATLNSLKPSLLAEHNARPRVDVEAGVDSVRPQQCGEAEPGEHSRQQRCQRRLEREGNSREDRDADRARQGRVEAVDRRWRHACTAWELRRLARDAAEACPRVVRHEKGEPECAGHEGEQRRTGRGARRTRSGEEDTPQHEPQRPHEQQPKPERFDGHGVRSVRAERLDAVSRRRLVTVALAVTALLALVAVVAEGRPLGSGSGTSSGLPLTFWSYVFTTFLIVIGLLMVTGIVGLIVFRRERVGVGRYQPRTVRTLVLLVTVASLLAYVAHRVDLQRLIHPNGRATTTLTTPTRTNGKNGKHRGTPQAQHVQFRWDELLIVLGVLVALGVMAHATGKRLGPAARRGHAPDLLAAALEESIDDLRTEPDVRRAIIAAYARMEAALAAAGLPRHHAEAPVEYMERTLLSLDTSAPAVRRLTDLFEWARFSQHEPESAMRDEAIDALEAVRYELRASEPVPA
jgi:Domain of unknown function (DUF4129)